MISLSFSTFATSSSTLALRSPSAMAEAVGSALIVVETGSELDGFASAPPSPSNKACTMSR